MEFEKLRSILAEILNLDPEEITPDTRLLEELGADSMDLFEAASEVEAEFKVDIPYDRMKQVRTVRDILQHIKGAPALER